MVRKFPFHRNFRPFFARLCCPWHRYLMPEGAGPSPISHWDSGQRGRYLGPPSPHRFTVFVALSPPFSPHHAVLHPTTLLPPHTCLIRSTPSHHSPTSHCPSLPLSHHDGLLSPPAVPHPPLPPIPYPAVPLSCPLPCHALSLFPPLHLSPPSFIPPPSTPSSLTPPPRHRTPLPPHAPTGVTPPSPLTL